MTEQDVYIDCAAAHARASDLRGEANDARSLAQSMQSQLGDLTSSWRGDGASLFAQNALTRVARLNKAAARLDELAGAIDQTADAYQRKQISMIRAAEAAKKAASAGSAGSAS